MFSKKVIVALAVMGVTVSASALIGQVDIKGAFADTVKQNVVYTKEDTSKDQKDDGTGKVTGDEKEAYRQKSLGILKDYFNITVEENDNFKFSAGILNEKTLDAIKIQEKKWIQEMYDKKEISKEECDKRLAFAEENDNGLKERVQKIKHGMVQTGWIDDNTSYFFDFNENTKEIDTVMVSEGYMDKSRTKLTISEDQLKSTAEDFINEHKLGNIEKPKCLIVEKFHAFYVDENDSSKKVEIFVSPFTGKVDGFSVGTYADYEYERATNEK
jgi:uncharacterized protein YxeA